VKIVAFIMFSILRLMQLVLHELNWLRIRPHMGLKISPYFTKLYISIFMLPWRLMEGPYVDLAVSV